MDGENFMENPMNKWDDLGVPLFLETPILNPSEIEWDRIPTDPVEVSCDRAIRYSGLGVRSVGPVGDFLD